VPAVSDAIASFDSMPMQLPFIDHGAERRRVQ
jgi:hypothetical protein